MTAASSPGNRERIEALRNRYAGQQCVILCTGPSLARLDPAILERHPFVMGVNGAYLLRNRLSFYFASNPHFASENAARIAGVQAEKVFVRASVADHCLRAGLSEEQLILFDGPIGEITTEISTDLTRPLPAGPTVLLTIALPAVIWSGFSEVLLLGADFPQQGYARFHSGRKDAPSHLSKPLAQYEAEMEVARFRASLWRDHLQRHHPEVRVINCSPDSGLDAFEKAEIGSVLR